MKFVHFDMRFKDRNGSQLVKPKSANKDQRMIVCSSAEKFILFPYTLQSNPWDRSKRGIVQVPSSR